MKSSLICALILALALVSISSAQSNDFVNSKVKRRIEATTQVVKVVTTIDYQRKTEGKDSYQLYVAHPQLLSSFSVTGKAGVALEVTPNGQSNSNGIEYGSYSVKLVNSEASGKLKVSVSYIHLLQAFPEKIGQSEKQFVVLKDNHYFYSPYLTEEQSTTVEVPSTFENHSEEKPTSVSGSKVTYGPYNQVKALSLSPLRVHFENNTPFITVKRFVRTIEISHWGNVAVEDSYDIVHGGALLKGNFARADYQRNPTGSPSHIASMRQHLPTGVADVYYRDNIGNISTSNFNPYHKSGPLFEFAPRTPLFGGWKIKFEIGFNLPTSGYLFRDSYDSSKYVLNTTFISALENAVYDEVEVRVILPEGSKNPQASTPFALEAERRDKHATYLDTTGREVVVLTKKNLSFDSSTKYFQVTYNFSRSSLLQEPFLLIATFFVLFVAIAASTRFSYRIGEPKPVVVEAPVVVPPATQTKSAGRR